MRLSGLLALPILFVSLPAAADECASPADCGFGFTCLTTVTSPGSGTGGSNSGAAYGGTTGATTGGTGAYLGGAGGTVGNGGSSGSLATGGFAGTSGASGASGASGTTATGGVSGTSGTSGSGGTATTPPPPSCGNAFCEPGESPANCASDCVFSTICSPATCIDDVACAAGYYCPPIGSGSAGAGGAGGAPIATFCGDGLCTVAETAFDCPFDCDPNVRHCAPGGPGCQSNLDCAPGYVCEFSGPTSGDAAPATGGTGGYPGTGGSGVGGLATGGGAGVGTAGIGTGGIGTGGGTSGAGGAPVGGATGGQGDVAIGTCVPSNTGGTGGDYGGTSGTGGDYGGTRSTTGGVGGSSGGTDGDDERVIVTHGGCSCSLPGVNEHSSLAALLFGIAAFVGVTRRRSRGTLGCDRNRSTR